MKIDYEVLLHRILCNFGIHRWQMIVNYYAEECYWGCGKKRDIKLNKKGK